MLINGEIIKPLAPHITVVIPSKETIKVNMFFSVPNKKQVLIVIELIIRK